jgi:hypothetical protein
MKKIMYMFLMFFLVSSFVFAQNNNIAENDEVVTLTQ